MIVCVSIAANTNKLRLHRSETLDTTGLRTQGGCMVETWSLIIYWKARVQQKKLGNCQFSINYHEVPQKVWLYFCQKFVRTFQLVYQEVGFKIHHCVCFYWCLPKLCRILILFSYNNLLNTVGTWSLTVQCGVLQCVHCDNIQYIFYTIYNANNLTETP